MLGLALHYTLPRLLTRGTRNLRPLLLFLTISLLALHALIVIRGSPCANRASARDSAESAKRYTASLDHLRNSPADNIRDLAAGRVTSS